MHKTIPYEAVITDIIKVRGDISSMKENAGIVDTVIGPGVTSTIDVLIAPKIDDAADMEIVSDAQIMATAQATGTITFSAFRDKPTGNIEFNVKVLI